MLCPGGKKALSKFKLLNADIPLIWTLSMAPLVGQLLSVSQSLGKLLSLVSHSVSYSVVSAGQVPNCTVRKLFNQSFCQPVRHPTAQSQSQSTVSRSVNQLFNQLFCEPVRYPTPQSQSTVSQSVSQSFCQSVKYPTAQSVAQSVILSVSKAPNCTVSQSGLKV